MSGTAVLSTANGAGLKLVSRTVTLSGALTACSRIVTLAVFAGTSKGTVWPTVKVPRCCCSLAVLVPIGLSAAVQVAIVVPASATRHVPLGLTTCPGGQRVAFGGEFVLPLHAASTAAVARAR